MTLPDVLRDALFLPPEASSASLGIDALHAVVISISLLGAAAVAARVLVYVVRYRRRAENERTPRLEATAAHEIGIALGILALFVAFWGVGYAQYLRICEGAPGHAALVSVSAKQWTWKFAYEDGSSSNDELVVARGQPVKLVMTSRDVIHSFYVPAFRLKQDVLPGRYVALSFLPIQVGHLRCVLRRVLRHVAQHDARHGAGRRARRSARRARRGRVVVPGRERHRRGGCRGGAATSARGATSCTGPRASLRRGTTSTDRWRR